MQVIPLSYPIPVDVLARMQTQVLAIGEFDGVHLGHKQVLGRALERAKQYALPCAIMTFHPHPREVLGQSKYSLSLTPLKEKLDVFEEMHMETTYVMQFNEAVSKITPEQFVTDVLVPLRLHTVVVGFDFTFGYKGAGNPDTLCELSQGRFAVEVVRPFHMDGEKVGSTFIRHCLQSGELEAANRFLGRPYSVRGEVVHGEARGRQIGFPTANVQPIEPFVIPGYGVYAVRVWVDRQAFEGVANIGVKPTFDPDRVMPTIEAHLFDFHGDLYGAEVKVEFIAFLRGEHKFTSIDALVSQIQRDAEEARLIFRQLRHV